MKTLTIFLFIPKYNHVYNRLYGYIPEITESRPPG